MITLRQGKDRGFFDHGWLRTFHTFSFADYHDPRHMHWRALRVLNEDVVAPGRGFGMHPHRDMEILTWILAGALRHEDSMGHAEVLGRNEVQVMSAGTGVLHSEWNASTTEPVHLLQIWILPERHGLEPRYAQEKVDRARFRDAPLLIAAPPGQGAVVDIFQDVRIHVLELGPGRTAALPLAAGRSSWVQVARGALAVNGAALAQGDGAAIQRERELALDNPGTDPAEALVFDLA
ncbi:MAG: pirin family protein [Planctomycetota bacterium]